MARSASHLLPLALLFTAGCAPQTAILTEGQYWAFLSEATSFSLKADKVAHEDWPESDRWNVDCRKFKNKKEREALQLPDRLKVCDSGEVATDYERWLSQSAWHVVQESLDPWRGEAVITGEGDFQVTFHHQLPGGEDFRFAFVVDPNFQPTQCEANANGKLEAVPLDGDWLAGWTEDLRALGELEELPERFKILEPFIDDPDARLFYLNARGFQFNPGKQDDLWTIPLEWRAGFSAAKFAAEKFHSRAPRWGEPALYDFYEEQGLAPEFNPADLFFCDVPAGTDPADNQCLQNKASYVRSMADAIAQDLFLVGIASDGVEEKGGVGEPLYQPMVHDNFWREPDGFPGGLDAWVELHYNYVVISGPIEKGGSVTGAFSLLLDGDDSNSRILLQGRFEAPKIKEDRWTTVDIRAKKHEENGTFRCSQ